VPYLKVIQFRAAEIKPDGNLYLILEPPGPVGLMMRFNPI
jgi:hypothetical protein